MKPFVKYGLWTGLCSGIWCLGAFTVVSWLNSALLHDKIPATEIRSYSGLFSILILVIGIFLGMKQVRMRNGNILSYGQAVKTGVLISCITALMVACFAYLYCTVINPGYAEFMVRNTETALKAAGNSAQEISLKLEGVRKEFSTGAQVGEALVGQTVAGAIASLILGLFVRSKRST